MATKTLSGHSSRCMHSCLRLFGTNSEFIIFDTETTGLTSEDKIVELAAIKCKEKNGLVSICETLHLYINPGFDMEQKVIDVHGITNEFLADKPVEQDVFDIIYNFFSSVSVLVAYNISYDIRMLSALYERCNEKLCYSALIDVLEYARQLVSKEDTANYKLSSIAEVYGLTDVKFHSALDDALVTYRLLYLFALEYFEIYKNMSSNKEVLYINKVWFWDGYRKEQKGLYIATNKGKIWLSTFSKSFRSTEIDLDSVNMDRLEQDLCDYVKLPFNELCKLTMTKYREHLARRG